MKYTGSPSKCFASSGRDGPSPTKHRQALEGRRSRMPFSASRFFSAVAVLSLSTTAVGCRLKNIQLTFTAAHTRSSCTFLYSSPTRVHSCDAVR